MNIGFDNQKYLQMQSAHIRERISMFGDKLYLEFGGKLFDDYHAVRQKSSSRSPPVRWKPTKHAVISA